MRRIVTFLMLIIFSRPAAASAASAVEVCVELNRMSLERRLEQLDPRRPDAADEIATALSAWILGEKLGNARYRELSLSMYDRFLEMKIDHDFHQSRPFGMLTLRLAGAGALAGSRGEKARQQARERIAWFLDKRQMKDELFDCNISLADTLAVSCLARAFGDDPAMRAERIRGVVAALGRRILDTGDLNENACNYSSLGICFFLELARMEGWLPEVARSDNFRNMFARMRDIISPVGSIPEYGDGYFRHRQARMDFVLLLEVAARLFNDPSFQTAARRMLPAEPADLRSGTGETEDQQLRRAFMLMELEPWSAPDTSTPARSVAQYRRIPEAPDKTVPDKLILRTGASPGDAMVMIDLYAAGSHAHPFKRPSIGYYEADGVPLFHNLGRRGTRSGQCGNSFWILDQPDAFPGYPREGEWNTMTVPATYCFRAREQDRLTVGQSLLLRNFRTPDLKFLRFDNLRLEGPRGSLLLDGFESDKTWHANVSRQPGVKLVSSPDRTQGQCSQEVNWSIFGEAFCTRLFEQEAARDTTFSLSDYDTVKFDYKFEGQPPHCNLRNIFEQWIDLGDRPLHCQVASAEVRQMGEDAWGRVEFVSYGMEGNSLERRIVLIREGALIIVDRFTVGPRADGWAGGQLWQLYSLKEREEDWFASESDGAYALPDGTSVERTMLVKYLKSPHLTIGAERVSPATMHAPMADGSKRREFFTTYSSQPLVAGKTILAAMAVLPMAPGEVAPRMAARIEFDDLGPRGLRVTLPTRDSPGNIILTLADDVVDIKRPDLLAGDQPASRESAP